MKRITAYVLTMFIMIQCFVFFGVVSYAKDDGLTTDKNTAVAVLGKTLKQTGFKTVEMGENSTGQSIEIKDGEYGWLLNKNLGRSKAFINFALSDSFKPEKDDGSEYEIEFDYFDEGQGFFKIEYDAIDGTCKKADLIVTTNERKWKTAKVKLTDAKFDCGIGGNFDFRIKICDVVSIQNEVSPVSVLIKEVRVHRIPGANPIRVTASIDKSGNTFGWTDKSKIIATRLENLTNNSITSEVKFRLLGSKLECPFEKTEKLTFAPNEVKEINIDVGEVERCDVYKYNVSVSDEKQSINSAVNVMTAVIMKTDPDGIKNDEIYFAMQASHKGTREDFESAVSVAEMTNAGGLRAEIPWWAVMSQTGSQWEGSSAQYTAETILKHNMNLMALLVSAPEWAVPHFAYYCRTEEQMAKWSDYTKVAGEELNKLGVHTYEILNEGNANSRNWTYSEDGTKVMDYGGARYANMYKVAKQNITAIDPTAKLAGPTAAGTLRDDAKFHFLEAMEAKDAEFWKYDNVLSLHSYPGGRPEYSNQKTDVEWYREQYAQHGVEDIEIWHSETGYTLADSVAKGDEDRMGTYATRLALNHKRENTANIVCYHIFSKNGEVPFDREDMFGYASAHRYGSVLAQDGKVAVPGQGLISVTAYNYIMADSEMQEKIQTDDDNLLISKFKSNKFNKNILTIHRYTEDTSQVTLELGVDRVKVFDLYGNESEVCGENGVFTFMADMKPTYIMGDFDKAVVLKDNQVVEFNDKKLTLVKNDEIDIKFKKLTDENYTVEAELPVCFEVVSNDGFKGSEAVVRIKNKMDVGEKSNLKIKLMKNGKTIAEEVIETQCSTALTRTFSTSVADKTNLNKWKANITLKNNSFNTPLTGYIKFKSPDFMKELGKVDIGRIPAACTGVVDINLPDIKKKSQYVLNYDIVYDNGATENYSDKFDFTAASYAYEKPKIDGKLEDGEWNKTSAMYVDTQEQVKLLGVNPKEWGGIDDLSGYVMMEWDEDYLYLGAEMTDDVFKNGERADLIWKGDSIQFGIFYGKQTQVAMGQANTTYHEIGIGKSESGDVAYRWLSQDNIYQKGLCESAEVAITREGTKTYYEFKMPWKDIIRPTDTNPIDGQIVGFSFLVNENDGEDRRGWLEYASGIGESKNTDLFTYMTFIK